MRWVPLFAAFAFGACSVTSTPTQELAPKGMRCIEAHQEVHEAAGDGMELFTVCDAYSPLPEVTP